MDASVAPPARAGATVLFVDDEANILSALRRVFRSEDVQVLTAEGGPEALELLERQPVDVVVSDMRMPGMDGARFLEQVRLRWQDTVRLLLTGFADVDATIAAVNKGEIHRYVAKPWDDREIRLVVREAVERRALERERARLEALTRKQNDELRDLNASLEAKVEARTAELRHALDALSDANDRLRRSFVMSVKVFNNLIELRGGGIAGSSQQVADLARRLAARFALPSAEARDVFLAGLLHGIGKLGLPDALQAKPFADLTKPERAAVARHPVTGAAALMALEPLASVAAMIRAQGEHFDGAGQPDGLRGEAIPLGARILAGAIAFHEYRNGMLLGKSLGDAEALEQMRRQAGRRYDPAVVDAVAAEVEVAGAPEAAPVAGRALRAPLLSPGMVLAQDLLTRDGIMLLAKDYVLDAAVIDKLRAFEEADGQALNVVVQVPSGDSRP
jgi:response regulator RpfG family c-di-GMP phosphodiesterase